MKYSTEGSFDFERKFAARAGFSIPPVKPEPLPVEKPFLASLDSGDSQRVWGAASPPGTRILVEVPNPKNLDFDDDSPRKIGQPANGEVLSVQRSGFNNLPSSRPLRDSTVWSHKCKFD